MAQRMFVHVLLFECPQCGGPIESSVTSPNGNPEEIDAREFELRCQCNWTGKSHGFGAKRRVMIPWDGDEEFTETCTNLTTLAGAAGGSLSHAIRPKN